jgi:NodT family efflux transporter outer membrane factor (OMF) lipoprotein
MARLPRLMGRGRAQGVFSGIGTRLVPGSTATATVLALLAGCAVGPDFERPAAPDVSGYTPEPLAAHTASADVAGGVAQGFVPDRDIPGEWWALFRSKPLDDLIRQSLKANPDLQAAQAALREAQENVRAEEGLFFPSVDANLSATRERFSAASGGGSAGQSVSPTFNLYDASVSVSYNPDVFGGTRRQVESLTAQAEDQRYQLEATYLTLTSNLVTAAVQEASLRGQIQATEEIIKAESDQLDVLRQQFELGGASKSDVLAQEATLRQTQATLPPLQKQLAQQRNRLTALAGRLPSQEIIERFDLATLELPQELPVSLPSKLVLQRPDIRSAEALMHSASAQIGVATANQLPQITLSAQYGTEALTIGSMFTPATAIWSIAGAVAQPLFDAGTRLHKKRAAVAAYDQAVAQYRSTVLTAFQNVADSLRALQSDADALQAQFEAERSAADSLAIAREQYRVGAISYLTLLNAQNTYQETRISLVQAQAARYADTAALFVALGGGWWNRSDVAAAPSTDKPAPASHDHSSRTEPNR